MVTLVTVASLLLATACGDGDAADPPVAVSHQPLTFEFGDFQAAGQLDYPTGVEKAPVVILIPGSGPEDMDAAIGLGPTPKSRIFLDISNYLTQRGFAVVRYNKRYVSGYNKVDYQSYFTKLDLNDMLSDADQVLRAAQADPRVDPSRVFVYGWSEGSTVAAALAATHPELAGVVFQAPVVQPWRDLFNDQVDRVGLPYLREFDVDGELGPEELKAATGGGGGLVATQSIGFVAPASSTGDFTVDPEFDTDHDGRLDVDQEFLPGIQRQFDRAFEPGGVFAIYAPDRALPSVLDQVPKLTQPVLVLQGANDANVPPSGSRTLDSALGASGKAHTLREYPGLGHSLGLTSTVLTDDFQPIDGGPLADLVSWLADR